MQNTDFENLAEVLKEKGEASSLTSGCSMRPMLRQHKDIVTMKLVDRKLKKGDAVVYPSKSGEYVLHRIVAIKNGEYIIRGDNNYFTEYGITDKDIVGMLKCFYRDGKFIDCEKDTLYKLYSFYISHSYFLRYPWKKFIRPVLGKIKRLILGKSKTSQQ